MNKKQIQTRVRELLDEGTERIKVFAQLSRQGVKDGDLAYFIASSADPARRDEHHGKMIALVALMIVQPPMAFLAGFGIAAKLGPNTGWIGGILVALVPIALAWGFYRDRIIAYNACIFLTLIMLSPSFDRFESNPISTSVAAVFNIALFAFVWYVRGKLFPDLAFLTARKVRGRYVFTD